MSSMFPFEDFGAAKRRKSEAEKSSTESSRDMVPASVTAQKIEEARNEGYETGYKAGWDDAVNAEEETRARIGAELARNLQDLGFTFHEARSHVIKALEPLLGEMVDTVLPELVTQTIGQTIIEEVLPLAETASDAPIEILLCPNNKPAVEALVTGALPMALTFIEEPSLSEGQVFLRLGTKERKIDLDGALDRIRVAIDSAFTLNKESIVNG